MTEQTPPKAKGWPFLIPVLIALAISLGLYYLGGGQARTPTGGDAAYNAGYMVGQIAVLPVLTAIVIGIRNLFVRRG